MIKIIHENCNAEQAEDKTLPYNSYLVEYERDGMPAFDLTISDKQVDLFDYYWDNYKSTLKGWKQSEGRISPRLWGNKSKEQKEEKKRR